MNKEIAQIPEKTKTIKLENRSFTLNFPNIGQIMDIESEKARLSGGQYGKMITAGLISQNLATNLIDMVAVFGALIPNFDEEFKIKDIFKLDPVKAKEFLDVFSKEVSPWYYKWLAVFKEPVIEETSNPDEDGDGDGGSEA